MALLDLQKQKTKLIHNAYSRLSDFYNKSKAFKDFYYEKNGYILDVYSENPDGKDPYNYEVFKGNFAKKEGEGLNKEHIIPQNWFHGKMPVFKDANIVWPVDIKVNDIRSNYPHGKVKTVLKTTLNHSKLGYDKFNNIVFEPVDDFKGDIARVYFYYVISYLDLTDFKIGVFQKDFPYLKKEFLDTYLTWNINDPVSSFDITRNNEVYKYQCVRNPFIDYPDLIYKILEIDNTPFENKGTLIKKE
ncbi:endonuclease [Mycoplasmopsis cynos]|uniref:Extracellular ribonuclease n=1 Tax=Mycoplasmopsis cynos TaxID=171284 RepID=A0A449AIH2_9BACT|nr:endonuclease [Mycoplasmopsis cynos]TQC55088.1 hypothetical protein E1I74_00085 [Mycoplasmopsis cynos]VEU64769.1 Extracellular ribonuclease precursor [Mycoplasmopsis cynos]